jgi:tRNA(Ile)-lysidine synthase
MNFTPENILPELLEVGKGSNFVVALSGGLDSLVLLYSLNQLIRRGRLTGELAAIHVNHGLNPAADDWQAFCVGICEGFEIPLQTVILTLDVERSENLEERARNARYAEFESMLRPDQCLLLGHHRDDQMETLMLRLMRGSGPRGIAGMPLGRSLGDSQLLRPLLKVDRASLMKFATEQGLNWVEDDSNQSHDFDRNYVRHELLPIIEKRWPGYRQSWEKALVLNQEADTLLAELAAEDLAKVATARQQVLDLVPLLSLSVPRQRNLLRHWLETLGFLSGGWHFLRKLTQEIIPARPDSSASLRSESGYLQRFRNQLFALDAESEIDTSTRSWNLALEPKCDLVNNGQLQCVLTKSSKTSAETNALLSLDCKLLSVKFRQGGELFQSDGRPHKTVKKLMQEFGVAPWLRSRYPLIYFQDELVCIPGIGVSHSFVARPGEQAYRIRWHAPELLFKVKP